MPINGNSFFESIAYGINMHNTSNVIANNNIIYNIGATEYGRANAAPFFSQAVIRRVILDYYNEYPNKLNLQHNQIIIIYPRK